MGHACPADPMNQTNSVRSVVRSIEVMNRGFGEIYIYIYPTGHGERVRADLSKWGRIES